MCSSLGCVHSHVVDTDGGRNGADEAHQLLVGVDPHATMPLRQPTRRSQGPKKEVNEFIIWILFFLIIFLVIWEDS